MPEKSFKFQFFHLLNGYNKSMYFLGLLEALNSVENNPLDLHVAYNEYSKPTFLFSVLVLLVPKHRT